MLLLNGSVPMSARTQSAANLAQRPQGGLALVTHDAAVDRLQRIPTADLDLLVGALLCRLAACVSDPPCNDDAAPVPVVDVLAVRATVLECVQDLQNLRVHMLDPESTISMTDACGRNGGGA